MQSLTNLIVKTTPHRDQDNLRSGPVGIAIFIGVLALVISLGAFWLGSSMTASSAQAAPVYVAEEE